jgi:hypothetical protein
MVEASEFQLPPLERGLSVTDVRRAPRFVVNKPLKGEIAGGEATVRNLSRGGFGLVHTARIQVGAAHRLHLRDDEFGEKISLRVRLVWSHMSKERADNGAFQYESGVSIDEEFEAVAGKLGRLMRYYGQPEQSSMERKRLQALSRLMKRVETEQKRQIPISPADLLLCYQALKMVEEMAAEERVSLAGKAQIRLEVQRKPGAFTRDVLAAWEVLDGRVEPRTIETSRSVLSELRPLL